MSLRSFGKSQFDRYMAYTFFVGDSELCHLVIKHGLANKHPCQALTANPQISISSLHIEFESVKKMLSNRTLILHHNSSAQRFVHLSISTYEQLHAATSANMRLCRPTCSYVGQHAATSTDEHRQMWTNCRHM
jgi:hypothetical protein